MSRNPLWAYLDQCGIEFRRSKADLIAMYGAVPSGWTDNWDICALGAKQPFLDGTLSQLSFNFDPRADQSSWPDTLTLYERGSDDAVENFKHTAERLSAIFGSGEDNSVSNTRSQRWTFPDGKIVATIYSPHLNTYPNSRHGAVPGSATECSVQVMTGYCRSISQAQLKALREAPVFWGIAEADCPRRDVDRRAMFELRLPDGEQLDKGTLKIAKATNALYFSGAPGTVDRLPLDRIISVNHTQLKPARGSGDISIRVIFRPQGHLHMRPTVPNRLLPIVDAPYLSGSYVNLADALAATLGVPAVFSEQDDV